jgi:hypothetical protein
MLLTLILLMWRIGWAPNSISIYIQQDTTLHNLFVSGNCSTCFGWYLHSSSGAHTTVSTASVICHTVAAIWRYRGRVGTGLSVLWVNCLLGQDAVNWLYLYIYIYIYIHVSEKYIFSTSRLLYSYSYSHISWLRFSVFFPQL